MTTVIREFKTSDKEKCLVAFKSNVPLYFTEEEINLFDSFLDNFHLQTINGKYFTKTYYFVVESENTLVGCGGFGYNDKLNAITLAWGLVHKDFHKKGFGLQLLKHRLDVIKTLHPNLPVMIDTTQHSYPFFEKYGFVTIKLTPDYYTTGMHRYDMIFKSL